ncbi:MAG: hypothetical protein RIA63_10780 [Cyclobacteriaceae bacterium]
MKLLATASSLYLLSYSLLAQTVRPNPYSKMAPVESYLISDKAKEITLAKSAAQGAISKDATIMLLTKQGYEIAVEGTNGFVCLVDRSFTGPWENPEFWNPKHIDPICYNPAAVRTVMPHDTMRTNLALKGFSKEKMREEILKAYGQGKLKAPEVGALAFMMSKEQNLGDAIGHWQPHIMYYIPYGKYFELGAIGKNAPTVPFDGQNEIMTTVLIPVQHWSDGSPAPGKH